jgi:type IX secretion system PorP/SprF family membrane protein
MSKVNSIIACITFIIISFSTNALIPDPHFTQFYQVPGQFNPALTGTFGGLYRVGLNYRDQWDAALTSPFKTFSASGDIKFELGESRDGQDIFALGILFMSDRVGIIDLNATGIALTGAYHKSLDVKTKQYLGGGVQIGITQLNVNYEDLTFQDQFNAIDAYTGFTNENLPENNFGNFDLSFGLNYSITPYKRSNINVGAALFHIIPGNVSFFNKNDNSTNNLDINFIQERRLVVHAHYDIPTSETIALCPRALFMSQGSHNQIQITNLFKLRELQNSDKEFFFGPGVRLVNDTQSFKVESLILQGGMTYKGLIFGLSYDHFLDDILDQRAGLGALEFSINFLGQYQNEDTFCPVF